MKLSFFRPQKPDPKPTMAVFVPQRAPQPTPQSARTPSAPGGPVPTVDGGLTVPIRLKSILPQIPRGLFLNQDQANLTNITLTIPASLVTGQLYTGKVLITLSQLAGLLPEGLVDQVALLGLAQHTVLLPLAEVIAVIPPAALAVKPEREISLDSPELAKLPGLFEPAAPKMAPPPTPTPSASAPMRVLPVPAAASSRPIRPPSDAAATVAIPVTPTPKKNVEPVRVAAPPPAPAPEPVAPLLIDIEIPEHLHVSVRGLIAGLPDNLFVCPKADLDQRTDLSATVEVPVEPLLPQLQKGRLTLPVGNVIDLLPRAILCQPLPATDIVNVPLPLGEIVPQLPPRLFTSQLSSTQPHEFESVETEIPTPFQERTARVTVRPSTPPITAPVDEAPEEVAVEELEHEEIPIFAEKKPAAAAVAPPEPVAPLPPVPVAEVAPVVEAVVPAAPVAEEITPVAADVVPATPVEEAAPVAETPLPVLPFEEPPEPSTPTVETVVPALVAEEGTGVIDERKFLIDLNRCSVEDLVRIPGVGRTLAQRVVAFRNNRGQFTSLDELRLIPGIGRKTFRALTGAEPRSLNRLLGVDDARELTLQEIVKLTSGLPGIEGSMLAMSDGLFLTGQLPPALDQEAISVFAPQLFKRVGRYVKELKVGSVSRFTIFTEERPISIFHAGDVYLVIIHDTRHFSKKLLRQCERISQEIARLCRQRTVV